MINNDHLQIVFQLQDISKITKNVIMPCMFLIKMLTGTGSGVCNCTRNSNVQ